MTAPNSALALALNDSAKEYLTFKLADAEYGINVLQVQEIRGYETPTRLVTATDSLKGVINLRGTIVPILDLRARFNVGDAVYDDKTAVIITRESNRLVGLVVDAVTDVLSIKPEQVKPAPASLGSDLEEHLIGLGMPDDERMLMLIDPSNLL